MRELADDLKRFDGAGPVSRAVVLATWGSAPRPAGAVLLRAADGRMAGSVSGGCVENAVLEEMAAAAKTGRSKRLRYEVTDETAWQVGLACGGTIEVLVEPVVAGEVRGAALVLSASEGSEVRGVVVASTLDGERRWVVAEDGSVSGPEELPSSVVEEALKGLRGERSVLLDTSHLALRTPHLFLESFPRAPELCIIGAGHVAQELVPLAKRMGFRTIVFDARDSFLTAERFPDADELIRGWPAEMLPERLGPASYVAVLSHDPKFDEPCVRTALRSEARYVGVIGSKKNQEKRRAALAVEGFSLEEVGRLRGPIGLPLGGKRPNEVALSIMAEVISARYGG
jgi:xanthine dehydrogenase accessory factor